MNTDFIKGVIVPILTPINENEFIDEAKLREQVNYVIEGGVSGILAFGHRRHHNRTHGGHGRQGFYEYGSSHGPGSVPHH